MIAGLVHDLAAGMFAAIGAALALYALEPTPKTGNVRTGAAAIAAIAIGVCVAIVA